MDKSNFDKNNGGNDKEYRKKMTKLLIMLAAAIALAVSTFIWVFPKLDALMDRTEMIAAMTDSQEKAEALSAHIDELYTTGIIGMAVMTILLGAVGIPSYVHGHVEDNESKIKRGTTFIKLAAVCLFLLIAAIIMKVIL